MEQPAQPVTSSGTKAIVISLILIVLGLTTYFLDMSDNKGLQWVGYIIFFIGIIWSVNSYGKQIDYNSTFGNYFSHGFKTTAMVTLIMVAFMVLVLYLFPDMKEKSMEAARKGMVENKMTEEQITQAMGFTKKFFMVFAIGGALVFYLFVGAIASLIGAGITKKNPVQFTDGR